MAGDPAEARTAIRDALRCPRCRSPLEWRGGAASCPSEACGCGDFPRVGDAPVLIDFEDSIFERSGFEAAQAANADLRARTAPSRRKRRGERHEIAEACAADMLARLPDGASVLVIGGGSIGAGAESLYEAEDILLVGTDVYASPQVAIVADGHRLPFADGSFDAVWIQAVLEHVLGPETVVAEIHRVLRPGGLVYADTPFMQQVHEGAYDFTRFTVSGQRWLFRRFACIEAGATRGAGTALLWSIRYLVRALTDSHRLSRLGSWPFGWLRLLDGHGRLQQDAASGVYFYGTRSEASLRPEEMVRFYEEQAARRS